MPILLFLVGQKSVPISFGCQTCECEFINDKVIVKDWQIEHKLQFGTCLPEISYSSFYLSSQLTKSLGPMLTAQI